MERIWGLKRCQNGRNSLNTRGYRKPVYLEYPSGKTCCYPKKWWTWTVRIRTIAKLPIEVNLLNTAQEPIYQKISNKSLHLRELGFSNRKIAEHLNVDEKNCREGNNLESREEFR